jgi:hypothetical protein
MRGCGPARRPAQDFEWRGHEEGGLLSIGFRCDKEMKLNPFGFNLNFDEILVLTLIE